MVLEHVANHARIVVVIGAVVHIDRLRDGDLHVADVVAVPQGLEDRVREAQVEDVLRRLLAEVVVDAVDLRFVPVGVDLGVQGCRRFAVFAERFLHHQPPRPCKLVRTARHPQVARRRAVELRCRGEVVDAVRARRLHRIDHGLQAHVVLRAREVGDLPAKQLREPLPGASVEGRGELARGRLHEPAELVRGVGPAGSTDDRRAHR